jgi:hypothetical protein
VPAAQIALAALATLVALLVAGCSGPSTGAGPTATPGAGTTGQGAAPGTASPTHRLGSPAARAARFEPWTVSAVSAKRIWVLGSVRCAAPPCRAGLYRSFDGGRSWRRLRLPTMMFRTDPGGAGDGVSGVAFANDTTGWLFGPDLWVTHTGGLQWRQVPVPGDVKEVAVGSGTAWAMVGACSPGQGCAALGLMRADLPSTRFAPVTLPSPLIGGGPVPDLAAAGNTVAVLTNLPPGLPGDHGQVEVSHDQGKHWVVRPAPCVNELGGTISVSAAATWASCPTGSLANVFVSERGPFKQVNVFGGPLPSFTSVTAVERTSALVSVLGSRVYQTPDGGRNWRRVFLPPQSRQAEGMSVSFASRRHGYAVAAGAGGHQLIRTDDGGLHWRAVPLG